MTILSSIILSATMTLTPAEGDYGAPHPDAPEQLAHMAPLIGAWDITDYNRNAEGDWVEGNGADWTFYYALDGWAIQDLWVAPGYDTETAQRQIGSNIRRVDPRTGDWEMAWITNGSGPTLRFTATSTEDEVVMQSVAPHFTGAPSRITFFNMEDDSFDWKLERAADGETYIEIYRIRGARKAD